MLKAILIFLFSQYFILSCQLVGAPVEVDPNDPTIQQQANFAVEEYGKSQNTKYELVKVINATEQVVEGILYNLFIEIKASNFEVFICNFEIWFIPWLNITSILAGGSCNSVDKISFK